MPRIPYKDPKDLRTDTFAMRVNSEERHMLVALAQCLQRTQSDVVRLLIRQATRALQRQGFLPPDDRPDTHSTQEHHNDQQ